LWSYVKSSVLFTPSVCILHTLCLRVQARGAISLAIAHIATEVAIALRGIYLAALFAPMLLMSPLVFYWGVGRPQWLLLFRWTLENAGPAFIKWGQWGSTRPDLFPRCALGERGI
jgi:aarF domain-containing kinase